MSHTDVMKRHLIGQFDKKPVIDAILEAVGEEMDEISGAFEDLRNRRWIDTGDGVQLDGIGKIVDRDRIIENSIQLEFFGFFGQPNTLGFESGRFRDVWEEYLASNRLQDTEYRKALWQKVFKNSSPGTAEDTIASLRFVFDTDNVVLQERGNAKIAIAIGRELTSNDISIANAVDLFIRSGGVGVEWQVYYDSESFFGFLGQTGAKGFDAGKFADIF